MPAMIYQPLSPHHPSPIQRLPVELLSYIFVLGTHGWGEGVDPSVPFIDAESIKTPLAFSRVDHHWRNVAHNTPSLWTSICITAALIDPGTGQGNSYSAMRFNSRPLETYLALSRTYPLDIVIDARDPDWNFQEPEITFQDECDIYTPPFPSAHMNTAISLLLPHLSRWRSLSILTDSWAPMYVALQTMQPYITTSGAPFLESLTLMRCNHYVSYYPKFEPQDMRDPAFLSLKDSLNHRHNPLPRLRNLTLRGVHADWSSLAIILSQTKYGLSSLDLTSHCMDVRPTPSEFHQLLSQCPNLTKLVVNGSGPQLADDNDNVSPKETLQSILLPRLHDMTIGYRSVPEGQIILEMIDAPTVCSLALTDRTHPCDIETIDSGSLLTYLATGNFPERDSQGTLSASTTLGGEHVKDDSQSPFPKIPFTQMPRNSPPPSKAMFPLLQDVELGGLKTCPSNLYAFFATFSNLRHVEFNTMPMETVHALFPQEFIAESSVCATMLCPCPQLQSLVIRNESDNIQLQDSVFLIDALAYQRFKSGGSRLQEVEIYIGNAGEYATEDVVQLAKIGTIVKIFRKVPQDDEDDLMDCDTESDLDPFEAGGAFNDPIFDAQYTSGQFNY